MSEQRRQEQLAAMRGLRDLTLPEVVAVRKALLAHFRASGEGWIADAIEIGEKPFQSIVHDCCVTALANPAADESEGS